MSAVDSGYLVGWCNNVSCWGWLSSWTLKSVTLLWQKALATSFIRHGEHTGKARRLRTALRRWARLLYSKAFSALHLAPKKASPGRVTAALQTNKSAPRPRSTQERPASRLAWTTRLPLRPSPPKDVIGSRRSWVSERRHLPLAPSPRNDVTGPCLAGGGA